MLTAAFRIHGADTVPLLRYLYARNGTDTNLLIDLRDHEPRPAALAATATTLSTDASWTHAEIDESVAELSIMPGPSVGSDGLYDGLMYGPTTRPRYDPADRRRWNRPCQGTVRKLGPT